LLRRISYQLHQRAGVHMTTMAYHDTATPIGGACADDWPTQPKPQRCQPRRH
jgi:hypothetical protein